MFASRVSHMSSGSSSNPSFGRYEILSELGRGSMGVVYQARDPKIDRIVAIKTLSLGQEDDDEAEFRMRFILEAQAAGRLSHPGIVTVYDVAEDTETHAPYIVMEYVAGQTLKKLLAPGYAKVPLETALRLAQEVAEALAYAHARGVVHRDIKPANIMITEDEHAKIMDFGVAKLDLSQRTQSGVLMGTPAYMSPEQLTGHSVDGRSDIFSLGVVLYTMLVGHRPFQGNGISTIGFKVVNNNPLPLTTINPALPPEIDSIVSRAIAKELDKRYQSGSDLANDLANLRQQLRDGNQDAPDPGLLTVTSSKASQSSRIGCAENPTLQQCHQGDQSAGAGCQAGHLQTKTLRNRCDRTRCLGKRDCIRPASSEACHLECEICSAALYLRAEGDCNGPYVEANRNAISSDRCRREFVDR